MSAATDGYPSRIVCLTEEPTEVLYALGEQDRIVGISGFTVRPPQRAARKAEGLGFHQREDRRDPRARTGPRDRLLRYPGRHRRDAGPRRGSRSGSATTAVSPASSATSAGSARWSARPSRATGWPANSRRESTASAAPPTRCRGGRASTSRNGTSRRSAASAGSPNSSRIAGGDDIFPERAAKPLATRRILADRAEVIARAPDTHRRLLVRQEVPARAGRRSHRLGGDRRRARPSWPRSSRRSSCSRVRRR